MGRSGLEKLYLRYCYELGYLPKYNQKPSKVHSLLKDDLLKCDMYSEEAKLLTKLSISNIDELLSHKQNLEKEIATLEKERDELRRRARRNVPEDERRLCKEKIGEKTAKLKSFRNELKLVNDIKERSETLKEKLNEISKDRHKEVYR